MVDGKLVRAPDEGMGQGAYVDGPRQSFLRRRGPAVDGVGLRAVPADAASTAASSTASRLLSPKTVELMIVQPHRARSSTRAERASASASRSIEHVGRSGVPGSVGLLSWGGAYHTDFWARSRKSRSSAVLMTQLLPAGGSDLHGKFRALVYQAIVTPAK